MNTWMMIVMLAALGLTMAVTVAVPEMSRPTLPLGVSVPSDRVGDPAVRSAIRRYRIWILVGGVVAVAVMVSAVSIPEVSVLILLGYVGWTVVAFAVCRKPIMVAINYHSLPDPMPTHYDAEGNATSWKPKSWGSALLLPLISCGSTLLLVVLCVVLSRLQHTRFPDGRPKVSRKFQEERGKTLQRVLAVLTFVSAILMSILAVAPVVQLTPAGVSWTVWGMMTASSLPVIWLVIDSVRQSRALKSTPAGSGPQSPDDDHLWRWSIFYENREDPRVWVEKRNGVGLTVNIGHPGGIALMGVVALLVLATIALVITVL